MAVAAQQDAGLGPVTANASDQPPDMGPNLSARRRFGGAQDESDRTFGFSFIDMDWRETALAVEPVPERQLLFAVRSIEGVPGSSPGQA